MKLPKIFGRKKSDDDEDDDLDDDAFDLDDFELDDDDHGGADVEGGGDEVVAEHDEGATDHDDEVMSDRDDAAMDDHDDEHDASALDDLEEEMIGGEDELENPFDGEDDDEDLDFDDDDEDEDAADEAGARKKAIVFAMVGAGVLLLSGLGGAGWWLFSGDGEESPVATAQNDRQQVEMSMPPPPGSLNSATNGGGASLNQIMSSGGASAEQAAAPISQEAPALMPAPIESTPEASPEVAESVPGPSAPTSLNSLNALGAAQAGGGVVVPAVSPTMLARLPDMPSAADQSQALSSAPVRALIENVEGVGDLPKIGNNGSRPAEAYARPMDPSVSLPKLAIMIEGVGLSRQASLAAINKLPPEVSMILSPYGRDLDDWVFRSRLAGHEVFMSLPMESDKFPLEDAGPLALDTRIQVAENKRRLETVMASAGGYVGLVSYMGSRFLKAEGQIRELLRVANSRGLMFMIGGRRTRNDATQIATDLGIPRAESEFYLDDEPSVQDIRTNLDRAVSMAKDRGSLLVMARPYPVTLQSIVEWSKTLEEAGVALAPASAVAVSGAGN